jgi:photosystem II stability/assembly factor-like uncharacterized protein
MKNQARTANRTESTLRFLCVFGSLLAGAPSAFAQTWTQTSAPTNNWAWIVSSADGSKLAATVYQACYTSTNAGNTWNSNSLPFTASIPLLAASADGSRLVLALSNSGEIDVSTNWGLSWTKSTNYIEAAWVSFVSSADGKRLVLTEGVSTVHASTNSGATWFTLTQLPNNGSDPQYAAISADGNTVVALNNRCLCSTTNFGASWATNNSPPPCRAIAASADCTKLATAPYGGNIYTSADSGMTWIEQTNSPNLLWSSIASSADGTKLAAVSGAAGGAGLIYTSSDSGFIWASNNVPEQPWRKIASSADGSQLAAVAYGYLNGVVTAGGIWAWQTTLAPQLNVSPSSANLAISWIIPSTNFVLQQSSDLTSWANVTNTPTLNLTNLQNQISLSPSNSIGFYRLTTP